MRVDKTAMGLSRNTDQPPASIFGEDELELDCERRLLIEDANKIWMSMQRQIHSIIEVLVNTNPAVREANDYLHEAFSACWEAVLKYRLLHSRKDNVNYEVPEFDDPIDLMNCTKMKIKVFAQWFVNKKLQNMAKQDEVQVNIRDKDNTFIGQMSSTEYRKKKVALEKKGYTAQQCRMTVRFSELATERDGKNIPYEPAEAYDPWVENCM